ncbi:MAG: aminodeoxychorismate/anthranilate synthase component II [bacterium]|nr:aminodeoxychorismate/anthranilate synthase component II [bacterium]
MLLMIDNYDSFTYNLVQYLGEMGVELEVFRNDEISISRIKSIKPEHIVISPGPGRPEDSGISKSVISSFYKEIPILGVCLGHQAIGEVFGAEIVHAPYLMHGKTSLIQHDGQGVFKGLPNPFTATRYHSLVIEEQSIVDELSVTARTEDNVVMGVRHNKYPLEGVQFHPESILTEKGRCLLKNFLNAH